MLSKRIIATLIAGSFAAAQAGAHSYLSDAAGSISDRAYQAQAGHLMLSEDSFPQQLTVFNPDGSSYSLVADAYTVMPESALVVMTSESISMPEHLTVFDQNGNVTEYQFTLADDPLIYMSAVELDEPRAQDLFALNGPQIILVEVAEPIIVAIADDGAFGNVGAHAEAASWSIAEQLAAFDEALARTG